MRVVDRAGIRAVAELGGGAFVTSSISCGSGCFDAYISGISADGDTLGQEFLYNRPSCAFCGIYSRSVPAAGAVYLVLQSGGTNAGSLMVTRHSNGATEWQTNLGSQWYQMRDAGTDGFGGLFAALLTLDNSLILHRVTSDGAVSWGDAGATVAVPGDPLNQLLGVTLAPDGLGGAFVTWDAFVPPSPDGSRDVFGQWVDASGAPRWQAGGRPLVSASDNQTVSARPLASTSGAIVAWFDSRIPVLGTWVQKFDTTGAAVWTPGGVRVCGFVSTPPRLLDDMAGGVYAVWADSGCIRAQHIDATGSPLWEPDGRYVTVADAAQPRIAGDGGGGLYIIWEDARNGTLDLYAQYYDASGTREWPSGGAPICIGPGAQQLLELLSRPDGTALAVWNDERDGTGAAFAQRIPLAGTVGVDATVLEVHASPSAVMLRWRVHTIATVSLERGDADGSWQAIAMLAPDGADLVSFEDRDVMAGATQRYRLRRPNGAVLAGSEVTIEIPSRALLAIHGLVPNPARGTPFVEFSLATAGPARIEATDVSGRRLGEWDVTPSVGRHRLALDGLRGAPARLWLTLTQDGRRVRTSVVRLH